MKFSSGIVPHARKILLFGTQGVGKSRWIAGFPNHAILDLEKGTKDFVCNRNEDPIPDYSAVLKSLAWLVTENHGIRTVGIDSLTKLQEMLDVYLTERAGKETVGEIGGGYGRGEDQAKVAFSKIMYFVDALIARNINVILTAHSTQAKITPPNAPSYEQTSPDLYKGVRALFCRYCDDVLYMQMESVPTKFDEGFGAKRTVNNFTETRQIVTRNTGGINAKNRLAYPGFTPPTIIDASEGPGTYIALVKGLYAQAAPAIESPPAPAAEPEPKIGPQPPATNSIEGLVVDGSSKVPQSEEHVEAQRELAETTVF